MRTIAGQQGFGAIDAFVAMAVLTAAWGGYLAFVGKNLREEYKSQGGFSQTALMSNILYKITSRNALFSSAPESVASCINGKSNCKNAIVGYRVIMGKEFITGTEELPALYTNEGRPCNKFGKPDKDCPLGAAALLAIKCPGGSSCKRPLYIYADAFLIYRPLAAGSQQTVKLSSASFANSMISFRNFIVADCSSQQTESKPDRFDPVQQQRSPLSSSDRSFFFGYDEAFQADMPDPKDRDYSDYCRKLRIQPFDCPLAGGGAALAMNENGTLKCTSLTGLTPSSIPDPGYQMCNAPTPGPTTPPPPTPTPTTCGSQNRPEVNGTGPVCGNPCQDQLTKAASDLGYPIPGSFWSPWWSPNGKEVKDPKNENKERQKKHWRELYYILKAIPNPCHPLRDTIWRD